MLLINSIDIVLLYFHISEPFHQQKYHQIIYY